MTQRHATTTQIWAALSAVYLVWGSTYLAIRVADRTMPPFLMAGSRFLIAGGLLFAWAVRRGDRAGDPLRWPQWRSALIVGALLLAGGNGGVSWAEQRVPSGVASLLIALVPIWMALFLVLLGNERVRLGTVAGLLVGFAGTALLVRATGSSSGTGTADVLGIVVLIGASISWASGSVISRGMPLARRPLVATGMEMICGGAVLIVLGAATGELSGLDVRLISGESLAGWLYLITVGSLVGFAAYMWLLRNAPTPLVSTYAYVNPVVAVFLGWAILSEPVTSTVALAALLIVGAVALIVSAPPQAAKPPAEVAAGALGPGARPRR
jgi:drug/metabolite transporter (DMT)-like permease